MLLGSGDGSAPTEPGARQGDSEPERDRDE